MREGVSFVVPVHNGAAWIRDTLEAIVAQDDGRPMEIIVVDDRSGDESACGSCRGGGRCVCSPARAAAPPRRSTKAYAPRAFPSSVRSIRTS
jgi:glycosyl transferase family 2